MYFCMVQKFLLRIFLCSDCFIHNSGCKFYSWAVVQTLASETHLTVGKYLNVSDTAESLVMDR